MTTRADFDRAFTVGCGNNPHRTRLCEHVRSLARSYQNADMADPDRWKRPEAKTKNPFVRDPWRNKSFRLRQVSTAESYSKMPMSSWHEFVPYRIDWGSSVWIENLTVSNSSLRSFMLQPIVERWKSDNAYRHTIMTYIEAAHLGPLPRDSIQCELFKSEGDASSIHFPGKPARRN